MLCPTAPTARRRVPPWGQPTAEDRLTSGNGALRQTILGSILTLIDARFSP